MHFYVQQVDIDQTSRRHEVILDVEKMDDHTELANTLRGQAQLNRFAKKRDASMLRFSYDPSGYQGLKEGSWYDIDPRAFEGTQYQTVGLNAEGSSFLRANLVGQPRESSFARFLGTPRIADISTSNLELVLNANPKGQVRLTVVNCGHGNWNEIDTASERVIYDVGASRWFNKAQVRAVVARRNIASETRQISVVISHWDVDHFHALLEFTSAELAKLRVVFVPSQTPNTETYRRVSRRLAGQGVTVVSQPPASRIGTSRVITLEPCWHQVIFTMFRATPGRSRNQTGIVLGVQGPSKIALLTGDHHYEKVLAAACNMPTYRNRACALVTPHHGGLAGAPSAKAWQLFFSSLTTPISCGANSYGHPVSTVLTELTAMQIGAAPWRTEVNGTWTTIL